MLQNWFVTIIVDFLPPVYALSSYACIQMWRHSWFFSECMLKLLCVCVLNFYVFQSMIT